MERVISILESLSSASAKDLSHAALNQAHEFRKRPWYSLQNLPFTKPELPDDLTALALVRTV
jgi:hypothetical protein